MKKLVLLCFASLILSSTFAKYHPLIDHNKKWVIQSTSTDLTSVYPKYTKTHYFSFFNGDTTINNVVYTKFCTQTFHHENKNLPSPNDPVIINDTLQEKTVGGYFREDTLTQQVFRYADNVEKLWFDFTLQTGDTIANPDLKGFTQNPIVDSTSILTLNNLEKRKFIHYSFSGQAQPNNLIEGIGSTFGIIFPFSIAGLSGWSSDVEVLCYSDTSGNNLYGTCNYPSFVTSTKALQQKGTFSIYPNPSTNNITVKLNSSATLGEKTIIITNVNGQIVTRFTSSKASVEVDIHQLTPGIYSIVIRGKNQIVGHTKFVKRP